MDYSLFPKKEEWGSGDEAMDNKLSVALKKTQDNLTFESIREFYYYGLSLKPRAYNPGFHATIEFVTKAFLFQISPEDCNNQLMLKIKGDYYAKRKVVFDFPAAAKIVEELKQKKNSRYAGEIDFFLYEQSTTERNPFVRGPLKRSKLDLHTKILMKDFKLYLSGEKDESAHSDSLFRALRMGGDALLIEHFAEIWYHEGQIFSFPLFDI